MTRMTASQVTADIDDALAQVAQGERVVIDRDGQGVAVLMSVEDAELLEELEDRMDVEAAAKARLSGTPIPWEQFKAERGLP